MRTLKEIDEDVNRQALARATELVNTGMSPVLDFDDIWLLQLNARFDDKYREMHAALQAVEEFLNRKFNGPDGGWDEASAKDNLKKLLEAV